jgi:Cu(I)/Ag(I) efflux system membrane protein CusA/SilA
MLATGMKTPLGIKLAGQDSSTLQELGQQLEELLSGFPETKSVYAERSAGGRYLIIDIDRDAVSRYGLNIADIHEWLQMAVGGMAISESVEGEQRYPISLRFPDDYRDTPESLRDLPIWVKDGLQIRLADVATLRVETGAPMLKSENARINTWIYLDVGESDIAAFTKKAEELMAAKINWPSGYTMRWSGRYESIQRAQASLLYIIPLTLCSIAILLFLNFRRFSDVFLLLASLPFALVGGLLLVLCLDFKLSVAVVVGFIALAGLAVETGAIMLQVLRANISDKQIYSREQLIQQVEKFACQVGLARGPDQGREDPARGLLVEIAGRLVGQQDVRAVRHGARDRDPLLLAAGKPRRPMALTRGDAEHLQQLARPLGGGAAALAGQHVGQHDVLERAELG